MLQEPAVAGLGVMAYSLGAGDRERKKGSMVDWEFPISTRYALGNPGKPKPVLPAHILLLFQNLCYLVS